MAGISPAELFEAIQLGKVAVLRAAPGVGTKMAERILIEQVLQRARGNISRSARMLGINRSTLYAKLREYKIGAALAT